MILIEIVKKINNFNFFFSEVVHGKKESHFPSHSSVNNQITKMLKPGERINIQSSVVLPGGSVQWVQNNKPILLVSWLVDCFVIKMTQ